MVDKEEKRCLCACGCGQSVWRIDKKGRSRKFVRGHSSRIVSTSKEKECRGCGKTFRMKKRGQSYCSDRCHYPPRLCSCGCGKSIPKRSRVNSKAIYLPGHQWLGKKHTEEELLKISDATKGKRNPNWQGGIAQSKYTTQFLKKLRYEIRKEYKDICAYCAEGCKGKKGHVHHIDYDKMNNDLLNLLLLCDHCHGLTIPERDREFWKAELLQIRHRKGTAA